MEVDIHLSEESAIAMISTLLLYMGSIGRDFNALIEKAAHKTTHYNSNGEISIDDVKNFIEK